jgi:hypothetical protein
MLPLHSLAVLSSHFSHITQLTVADSYFGSSTTFDALCKSFPQFRELDMQSVRWGPGGGWNAGSRNLHRLILAEFHSTSLRKGSFSHLEALSLFFPQEYYTLTDNSWHNLLMTVAPSLQRLRFVVRGHTPQLRSLGETVLFNGIALSANDLCCRTII